MFLHLEESGRPRVRPNMKVRLEMSKDYSELMNLSPNLPKGPRVATVIDQLGWQPFFAQQISVDDLTSTPPVRVTQVHRSGFHVVGNDHDLMIPPLPDGTVGDWLLLNEAHPQSSRILERKSLFKRRAPGTDRRIQLIAANIDTAFIVTSCNEDFNIARLERYVAVAFEAGVDPVILLTKPDLCDAPDIYQAQAGAISDRVPVILLDARATEPAEKLGDWCRRGQSLAFLGSSGVGKSTLINALSGTKTMATSGIREDDAKGRHTTTHRHLHLLPNGCTVLDTPGMRELQMTDAASGIADVFADLSALAERCKFNDCGHDAEPGCAILDAIEAGEVDPKRLARWKKLAAEEQFNSSSLAERRAQGKAFGKMIKSVKNRPQLIAKRSTD